MIRMWKLIKSEKMLFIKLKAKIADWVATKTYVVIETDVTTKTDVVTQSEFKEEKDECRDKGNSILGRKLSRQLNNILRSLMSQPEFTTLG